MSKITDDINHPLGSKQTTPEQGENFLMIKIDLHIHSIFSGHAFGTIYEIAAEAAKKSMQMIAITDHGPSLQGVSGPIHFEMRGRMPQYIDGVRVLLGCEANIINEQGDLDLSEKRLAKLDLVLASLHKYTLFKDLGYDRNTRAILNALQNPYVKIISHPLHQRHECDTEAILNKAIDQGVLLELNLAYLRHFPQDLPKFRAMIELVRRRGVKLIVNSDAHFLHEVGDDSILQELWKDLNISDDLIINNFPEELYKILGLKT